MLKTALVCILLGLAIIVWQIVVSVRGSYQYEAAIEAEWSLADKSSTIPAKKEHLDRFVAALENQGFQGQYNAIIYPTPDNSFDTNLTALKNAPKSAPRNRENGRDFVSIPDRHSAKLPHKNRGKRIRCYRCSRVSGGKHIT